MFCLLPLWLREVTISSHPLFPKIMELEKFGMNVGVDSNGRLREGKKYFVKYLLRLRNIMGL